MQITCHYTQTAEKFQTDKFCTVNSGRQRHSCVNRKGLCRRETFAGFVAGFPLADGIAKELEQEKAYSFDDGEEELARKAMMVVREP